ncbi:MAG TPA: bifunctional [glutamine synthetase] adenylyltransferase/[glutamine synthetase]-adenylyl-L-tyrosine phosphorylase [Streptosporangiaceae bacterium]|nr:bifunctional [glutamine synthetase] adenylyltransferase/[glutamine synthetase]-adenylyl-L-tyrosine phosphorylase [Streptosporangiaceae bacterium]
MGPRETLAGRLAALGFADTDGARRVLTDQLKLDADGADADLVVALAAAADPDQALIRLAALGDDQELVEALRADQGLRDRLVAVLGVSAALADHLRRHRGDWRLLASPNADAAPTADELSDELGAAIEDQSRPSGARADALRAAYRRRLLLLAARDLTGAAGLDEVMAELADLSAAVLQAALAIAASQVPAVAVQTRLAVIAMGKCGARELNYASDIDVIFVADRPAADVDETVALRAATQLASAMIRICSERGAEGAMFPVDANLRPEGRNGPLVRTVASHLAYYQRWAKTWEFQALLKARPVAGDAELGQDYLQAVTRLVWQAAQRDDFVADTQAMRRRVIASLPASEVDREIKLGPGGLRDIEFAVQLLQLVHGRADETLRDPATLPALEALAAGGYVGRIDGANLADSYRFLRAVEHLLQLRQLRRTHSLPSDPEMLRQLGRALRRLGYLEPQDSTGPVDPATELTHAWRRHATVARQLHEKLFYRPLLDAVARLPGDVIRLTSQAAKDRLEALGYVDPAGALRHIEALTTGHSRKAAIQRTLLPALLGWFADAPRPDSGLLAFRQVSEALGNSSWYLRLLRDDTNVAWRMARLLACGRYPTDLLMRAPSAVAMLADDKLLTPREPVELRAQADAVLRRHDQADQADAVAGLLALRRAELLRTAAADVLELADQDQVAGALSSITAVTIAGALAVACREAEQAVGAPLPTAMCVVAMGRFGGREMGYGSDADVLFVHQPLPGADEEAATRAAQTVADGLRRVLGRPGPDPSLRIDADLRPEGKQGPLVRTLAAYRTYYRRWAVPWEVQALLRADPIAGEPSLAAAFTELADEIRYPEGGLDELSVREIKRIKARMEAERMPRGLDPVLHLKLGPGGLSDTEWVAQLLTLRHAGGVPALRTTQTRQALAAARDAGLLAVADEAALSASWTLATRIRNAVMLVTGRAGDVVPTSQPDLAATARLLGYPPDESRQLVQDWRRAARRARAVMERVFYG